MKRQVPFVWLVPSICGAVVGCSDPADTSAESPALPDDGNGPTAIGTQPNPGAPTSPAAGSSGPDRPRTESGPSANGGGAGRTGVASPVPNGGRGGDSAPDGFAGAASSGAPSAGAASDAGGPLGGAGGDGGSAGGGFVGGDGAELPPREPVDCGPNGTALEDHGPPSNRVNYVIVADGYDAAELEPGGTLEQHLEAAMAKRFSDPIGQPYLRYRNFVNICVLRIPSGPICGQSEFGCCGDDQSRLANCDNAAVNRAISEHLPADLEVDWRAVVLNGSSWWNSGGTLMMWSGGNPDAGGAALHEGGHGHHFVSDEYGNCEQGRVSREATYGVNVSLTNGDTGGKWDGWLGFNQEPGTGEQGFFACDGNATWRASQNSMMNSLFGDDPNTSYNPVTREKIVMDIWRVVERPFDAVVPPEGEVTNPARLGVAVIDPEVIRVDWALDGEPIALDGGPSYDIGNAGLTPGTYTVTARAHDDAGDDLVRQVPGDAFNRQYWGSGELGHSDRTVTWQVTIE